MFVIPIPPEIVTPFAVVVDIANDTAWPTFILALLAASLMYAALPEPDTLISAFAALAPNAAATARLLKLVFS